MNEYILTFPDTEVKEEGYRRECVLTGILMGVGRSHCHRIRKGEQGVEKVIEVEFPDFDYVPTLAGSELL